MSDMRSLRRPIVLFAFLMATGLSGCRETETTAPVPPLTCEGTFWIDRWGQGRFGPYGDFVDETLFHKLQDYAGTPIRLKGVVDRGEYFNGPTLLREFREVEQSPTGVSLQLRWVNTRNTATESGLAFLGRYNCRGPARTAVRLPGSGVSR
jgi:hypothetical protein